MKYNVKRMISLVAVLLIACMMMNVALADGEIRIVTPSEPIPEQVTEIVAEETVIEELATEEELVEIEDEETPLSGGEEPTAFNDDAFAQGIKVAIEIEYEGMYEGAYLDYGMEVTLKAVLEGNTEDYPVLYQWYCDKGDEYGLQAIEGETEEELEFELTEENEMWYYEVAVTIVTPDYVAPAEESTEQPAEEVAE